MDVFGEQHQKNRVTGINKNYHHYSQITCFFTAHTRQSSVLSERKICQYMEVNENDSFAVKIHLETESISERIISNRRA